MRVSALSFAKAIFALYRYDNVSPSDIWPCDLYHGIECENKKTDTQYCWGFTKFTQDLYFLFTGTDGWRDVLTDAMFYRMDYPYGNKNTDIRVYVGPCNAYKSVRDKILRIASDYNSKSPEGKIYVSGHSLGAGLATFCAVDIQENIKVAPILSTTGSFRCGNKAFAKSYNKRVPDHERYVIPGDIVPMFPFLLKHCGKEIRLGNIKYKHRIVYYIRGMKDL